MHSSSQQCSVRLFSAPRLFGQPRPPHTSLPPLYHIIYNGQSITTHDKNLTIPNLTIPNQTKPNQGKPSSASCTTSADPCLSSYSHFHVDGSNCKARKYSFHVDHHWANMNMTDSYSGVWLRPSLVLYRGQHGYLDVAKMMRTGITGGHCGSSYSQAGQAPRHKFLNIRSLLMQ